MENQQKKLAGKVEGPAGLTMTQQPLQGGSIMED